MCRAEPVVGILYMQSLRTWKDFSKGTWQSEENVASADRETGVRIPGLPLSHHVTLDALFHSSETWSLFWRPGWVDSVLSD